MKSQRLLIADEEIQMVLNIEDAPSEQEIREAAGNAKERLVRRRFRPFCSFGALLFYCALVDPFLAGHSLHVHWKSFGLYLAFPTVAALPASVHCAALWWGARSLLRDLEGPYSRPST
jgi:hypothetical protein